MEGLLLTAIVVLGTVVIVKMADDRAKWKRRIEDEWHAIENEARWQANLRKNGFI